MIRPRLKTLGWFGLRKTVTFSETVIPMGLRRRIVVRTDDARGVLSWALTYKVMPGTLDGPVRLDGDEGLGPADAIVSRADYLWGFFCARKGGATASFIIRDLADGKDYLVQFADPALTYEMFMVRLFSAEGLPLVQVDEPDVNTLDDGSLGEPSETLDQI